MRIKQTGQRTINLGTIVSPAEGKAAALSLLGLRAVAYANGQTCVAPLSVPVRYKTPRTQHITLQ